MDQEESHIILRCEHVVESVSRELAMQYCDTLRIFFETFPNQHEYELTSTQPELLQDIIILIMNNDSEPNQGLCLSNRSYIDTLVNRNFIGLKNLYALARDLGFNELIETIKGLSTRTILNPTYFYKNIQDAKKYLPADYFDPVASHGDLVIEVSPPHKSVKELIQHLTTGVDILPYIQDDKLHYYSAKPHHKIKYRVVASQNASNKLIIIDDHTIPIDSITEKYKLVCFPKNHSNIISLLEDRPLYQGSGHYIVATKRREKMFRLREYAYIPEFLCVVDLG